MRWRLCRWPAGNLDADFAARGLHLEKFARQGQLVFQPPAEADGCGFAKENVAQAGHEIGTAEDGDLHAGAALLHLHRGAIDIPRAGVEQEVADIGEDLGIAVVDDGLDNRDGFGFNGLCSLLFADEQTQEVGLAGVSRPPAP